MCGFVGDRIRGPLGDIDPLNKVPLILPRTLGVLLKGLGVEGLGVFWRVWGLACLGRLLLLGTRTRSGNRADDIVFGVEFVLLVRGEARSLARPGNRA